MLPLLLVGLASYAVGSAVTSDRKILVVPQGNPCGSLCYIHPKTGNFCSTCGKPQVEVVK